MYPGTKIKIDGKDLIMPAISLGQLRNGMMEKLAAHDKFLEEGKVFEMQLLRGEILLEVLRRNYPDLDETIFYDNMDLATIGPIWMKILGISGFTPGEEIAAEKTIESGTSGPSTEA